MAIIVEELGRWLLTVPAGALHIIFRVNGKERETRTIVIAAGEEKEVVFAEGE